ncbi:hypothetical protein D3C71_2110900 [compost metagenome]
MALFVTHVDLLEFALLARQVVVGFLAQLLAFQAGSIRNCAVRGITLVGQGVALQVVGKLLLARCDHQNGAYLG